MRHPILTRALRLAAENRRLRTDCEQLCTALHLANDTFDRARMDLQRVEAVNAKLRTDLAGYQRITAALMETAPTDARSLDG